MIMIVFFCLFIYTDEIQPSTLCSQNTISTIIREKKESLTDSIFLIMFSWLYFPVCFVTKVTWWLYSRVPVKITDTLNLLKCTLSVLRIFVHSVSCHFFWSKIVQLNFLCEITTFTSRFLPFDTIFFQHWTFVHFLWL